MQLNIDEGPLDSDRVLKIAPEGVHAEVGKLLKCITRRAKCRNPLAICVKQYFVVWIGHNYLSCTEDNLWN